MKFFGLLQAAAILTIMFSLLTAVNSQNWLVELFCHFRLQYFVAALLLAVTFAVFKEWSLAAALLLTSLFNASFLLPWYLPQESGSEGAQQLKLFHANVFSGNDKYTRLIDAIASENPDIVFIQEATGNWVSALQSLREGYPHSYADPRAGNFGIAVYSKIPFDSVTHVESPPLAYPTIIARITFNDQPLTLVSSHPTIPLGRNNFEARNQQLDNLEELVSGLSGHIILAGDFNMGLWGARYRRLIESTQLRNARSGFGILPTWPTALPIAMIPIDHVLVSDGIAVLDIRTGRRNGSDHLPLVVTLSL